MNSDRDQNKKQQTDQTLNQQQKTQHSGTFREASRNDEKNTTTIEEEAGLEQAHKEAMTERD